MGKKKEKNRYITAWIHATETGGTVSTDVIAFRLVVGRHFNFKKDVEEMEIVKTVAELKKIVHTAQKSGKTIGLVPTMGYLHEGHLSLVRLAREQCDLVVVSDFVNPLQFGPKEDYGVYPRDLAHDCDLLVKENTDILFAPTVDEMYPQGYQNVITYVNVEKITTRLCGASRPIHFRGVATVVTKLFNLVEPDKAFFGQKDAQQVAVIRRMVTDLNMNVTIVAAPIIREEDGLAKSSRNVFLSPSERKAATVLYRSLSLVHRLMQNGETSASVIKDALRTAISAEPLADIEYLAVCDTYNLEELETVKAPALVALAVRFGKTRLIDNFVWEGK